MDNKEKIDNYVAKINLINKELSKKIVWQKNLIRDIFICLFARGHILIEWAPWLAKTLTVDSIAKTTSLNFKRIQFTPDLLPSDLVWNKIFDPNTREFWVKFGPIFTNMLLADEINRAPSKVQRALLESMAEKQVSIWDNTYSLDLPFIVLATQNPIEQEWTFSLPEAQLDRFLLKTIVDYPSEDEEFVIIKNFYDIEKSSLETVITKDEILQIQNFIKDNISYSDNILIYIRDLVSYTRDKNSKISKYITYWASPRASIALLKSSQVLAFLSWRDYILPEDIKEMAYGVLRHRIVLNYEAIASEIEKDDIIKDILDNVKVK